MDRTRYARRRPSTRGASSTWSSITSLTRACIRSSANGDPGAPAAELLRGLGIEPAAEGNQQ